MSANLNQAPLVCWQTDGTLKFVDIPTRESTLLAAAQSAADTLQQLRGVLHQAADDAEGSRGDEDYAETLRHFADVMCRSAANDLLAAIARATS
ncbi:hypothetical protein [Caudoviricetes sp.]|nr:hypothetical protein [Caudoviricetes sp.]